MREHVGAAIAVLSWLHEGVPAGYAETRTRGISNKSLAWHSLQYTEASDRQDSDDTLNLTIVALLAPAGRELLAALYMYDRIFMIVILSLCYELGELGGADHISPMEVLTML